MRGNTITREMFGVDPLNHQGIVMGGWGHDFGNRVRPLVLLPKM